MFSLSTVKVYYEKHLGAFLYTLEKDKEHKMAVEEESENKLLNAILLGDLQEIKTILEREPALLYKVDGYGIPPLIYALCIENREQRSAIFNLIFKCGGFEIDKTLIEGNTLLHFAVQLQSETELCKVLVKEKNKKEVLLPEKASAEKDTEVLDLDKKFVQILLKMGADINKVNEHGWNALCLATEFGSDNIVKFLVDKNAKFVLTKDARTPEGIAYFNGRKEILDLFNSKKFSLETKSSAEKDAVTTPIVNSIEETTPFNIFRFKD